MRKIFSVAVCISVLFVACERDDTTPPKFKMSGASSITISLNTPFNDPGVTAEDGEDGSITITSDVSPTNPDVNLSGHYIITYTATDAEGNKDQITRDVLVVNDAAFLAGAYSVDSCNCVLPYVDGIIPSTTVNNRIIFNQIGRYANANAKLEADIDFSTSTVTIVDAVINCGTFPNIVDRNFTGAGALANNNTVLDLDIYQTVLPSGAPDTCRYYYKRQ